MTKAAETIKDYFSKGINKAKWEEAKEKAKQIGSFGKYDDGKYEVQLVGIKTTTSKNGRLQSVMSLKFTSGEYKGKQLMKYTGIADSTEYLLNDLKILGYADIEPSEIEDVAFKELNKKKPVIAVRLKTKEGTDFQNVYLIGLVGGEKEEESDEDATDTEESDAEDKSDGAAESTEESDSSDDDTTEEESKGTDSDNDDDEEEAEEEKPKSKKSKAEPEAEEETEEPEETEEESEGDKLDVGTKLIVKVDKKEIKGEVIKIVSEDKKNHTGVILVKSLKTGKKYNIDVPDDVVEIITEE